MGILSSLLARLKLSATDAAIVAVVVLSVVNVLSELWALLSRAP